MVFQSQDVGNRYARGDWSVSCSQASHLAQLKDVCSVCMHTHTRIFIYLSSIYISLHSEKPTFTVIPPIPVQHHRVYSIFLPSIFETSHAKAVHTPPPVDIPLDFHRLRHPELGAVHVLLGLQLPASGCCCHWYPPGGLWQSVRLPLHVESCFILLVLTAHVWLSLCAHSTLTIV